MTDQQQITGLTIKLGQAEREVRHLRSIIAIHEKYNQRTDALISKSVDRMKKVVES